MVNTRKSKPLAGYYQSNSTIKKLWRKYFFPVLQVFFQFPILKPGKRFRMFYRAINMFTALTLFTDSQRPWKSCSITEYLRINYESAYCNGRFCMSVCVPVCLWRSWIRPRVLNGVSSGWAHNMLHSSSNQENQTGYKNSNSFISISGSKFGGGREKLENIVCNDR
jgi:hypothetical protein